jgi:hypothetical protein
MGNTVDVANLSSFIGKQSRKPAEKTFRRITAIQCNQMSVEVVIPLFCIDMVCYK